MIRQVYMNTQPTRLAGEPWRQWELFNYRSDLSTEPKAAGSNPAGAAIQFNRWGTPALTRHSPFATFFIVIPVLSKKVGDIVNLTPCPYVRDRA